MIKRKIVALVVAIISINTVVFCTERPLTVYAVEKTVDETKGELDEVLVKIKEMEAEAQKLQDEINSVQANIKNIEEKNDNLEIENEKIEKEIEALKIKKDEKYEIIRTVIKMQYEQKSEGYLALLLESKSFTNLLTRLEVVSNLIKNNNYLIDEIKKMENDLLEKNNKLQEQIVEVENQKSLAEEEMERLQELVKERDSELSSLLEAQTGLEDEIKAIQAKLAASASSASYKGGEMLWPLNGYNNLSSVFGKRTHPISGKTKSHNGIDIPAPAGTPVLAANSGVVISAEYSTSYGNLVVIDHGGGVLTYYAHNTKLLVSVGQTVSKGEIIATVGTTGYSTGNHLHFEVQVNGQAVDPMGYFG